jgi:hypothetical protein
MRSKQPATPQGPRLKYLEQGYEQLCSSFWIRLRTLGNQKLVVRGGFGIFYDRLYNNVFENIRFNPPFYGDELAGVFVNGVAMGPLKQPGLFSIPFTTNGQFISPEIFPNGLPKPVPRHIDQNLVTAYYEQYSLGFQYELAKDYAIEANYVGTLGRKLIGILNRNTFDGRVSGTGSAARPNPLFNNDNARGNYYGSNYNAVNITLRKRFSHGLSFNANYTYAKALDELRTHSVRRTLPFRRLTCRIFAMTTVRQISMFVTVSWSATTTISHSLPRIAG